MNLEILDPAKRLKFEKQEISIIYSILPRLILIWEPKLINYGQNSLFWWSIWDIVRLCSWNSLGDTSKNMKVMFDKIFYKIQIQILSLNQKSPF